MFSLRRVFLPIFFFFFNDTATTEIYTLSLHDALPIFDPGDGDDQSDWRPGPARVKDRKSTRLNSSHPSISYAVFCLKKKKTTNKPLYQYTIGKLWKMTDTHVTWF